MEGGRPRPATGAEPSPQRRAPGGSPETAGKSASAQPQKLKGGLVSESAPAAITADELNQKRKGEEEKESSHLSRASSQPRKVQDSDKLEETEDMAEDGSLVKPKIGEEQPASNQPVTPSEMGDRIETANQENADTMAKLEKLSQVLSAVAVTMDTPPQTTTAKAKTVDQSRERGDSGLVTHVTEDTIGQAALVGGLATGQPSTEEEEYQEAIQSSDAAEHSTSDIHIVGEIVAAATRTDDSDVRVDVEKRERETSLVNTRSEEQSPTQTTSQPQADHTQDPTIASSTTDIPMATKRPKRQLAASFGSQHL